MVGDQDKPIITSSVESSPIDTDTVIQVIKIVSEADMKKAPLGCRDCYSASGRLVSTLNSLWGKKITKQVSFDIFNAQDQNEKYYVVLVTFKKHKGSQDEKQAPYETSMTEQHEYYIIDPTWGQFCDNSAYIQSSASMNQNSQDFEPYSITTNDLCYLFIPLDTYITLMKKHFQVSENISKLPQDISLTSLVSPEILKINFGKWFDAVFIDDDELFCMLFPEPLNEQNENQDEINDSFKKFNTL